MKIRVQHLAGWCAATLLLSACAANGHRDSKPDQPEAVEAVAAQARQTEPDIIREPTDEEVMFRVFAAEYLEAAMRSEDPEIARRATRVAYAAEAWQQAAMAADRWALLDPSNVSAHESAALAMLLIGDYMGAEFQILEILDLMEDSTEACSHLAVRSKDLRRAFELARQAVELNPERVEFLAWAGRIALNLKLTETGLEYVRRAWLLDPEDHDLALAYADLLARNDHEDEARQVMREMPQSPDVMLSRILFELAAKDRPAAERLFVDFEQMDFSDPQEKAFYQAQSAEALGHFQQAIVFYGKVESGDRALAAAIRIAELMAMEGDMVAARNELVRLRKQPSPVIVEESWLAEARILREAGRKEESFQVLGEAVSDMSESIPILYSHALLAAELGWVDIAEDDLRIVIARQPENAAALNALGYTLADQTERYEEAEALIRQAYILQPEEASIVDSMGWIAFRRGRLAESIEFLQKAWQLDKNPEIAAHLGEVLWIAGNRDAAKTILREGHEVDDQNVVLIETMERLGVNF
jgi:tetratricopeptide (TPR) repeat protein